MRTDASISLPELYGRAATATAAGSKSFFLASRFFPPDLARSAHAVYWFCRWTDDLVDEAESPQIGALQLDAWEAELRSALAGHPPVHPVLRVFMDAVRRHTIPHEYPLDLIDGVRMDLQRVRYDSFGKLHTFCYRVACVVGLMMTHVIGWEGTASREEVLQYATHLGIGMQLTNILRDVGEDLDADRIYIPLNELRAFDYSVDDLMARRRNDAFRALMSYQIDRARGYYRAAEPGIRLLDPRGRFAVRMASDTYARILAVIEKSDYDVFRRRAVVPSHTKYWLGARSLARPAVESLIARFRTGVGA